jgi:hypothetical protein
MKTKRDLKTSNKKKGLTSCSKVILEDISKSQADEDDVPDGSKAACANISITVEIGKLELQKHSEEKKNRQFLRTNKLNISLKFEKKTKNKR